MARHRVLTPLRWSDMDAYGHVNNVQFLRLLEDARVLLIHAQGTDEGGTLVDTGLMVVRSEIEYLTPLVFRPEPVAIDMWVTEIKGASFDMGYEVLDPVRGTEADPDGENGNLYARAESTLVVVDRETQRPRRLRPAERDRLESWRDEPVVWRHRRRVS